MENLQTHTHCLILAGTGQSKHLAKLVPCEGDGGTRSHSFFFFFLGCSSMQDLSSPTRD